MSRKTKLLHTLISSIRYELNRGIHTVGHCQVCKTGTARGAGICNKCRTEELAQLVGKEEANKFTRLTNEIEFIVDKMEEIVSSKEE